MRPRLTSAVAMAALVALSAGCAPQASTQDSSGKFKGAQRQVATAVEDLSSAASKNDPGKICRDLLARSLADRLAAGGKGCNAAVESAIKNADSFDLAVSSVQITGDKATARVTSKIGTKKSRAATVQLVQERGGWRVAGF